MFVLGSRRFGDSLCIYIFVVFNSFYGIQIFRREISSYPMFANKSSHVLRYQIISQTRFYNISWQLSYFIDPFNVRGI